MRLRRKSEGLTCKLHVATSGEFKLWIKLWIDRGSKKRKQKKENKAPTQTFGMRTMERDTCKSGAAEPAINGTISMAKPMGWLKMPLCLPPERWPTIGPEMLRRKAHPAEFHSLATPQVSSSLESDGQPLTLLRFEEWLGPLCFALATNNMKSKGRARRCPAKKGRNFQSGLAKHELLVHCVPGKRHVQVRCFSEFSKNGTSNRPWALGN